MNKRIKAYHFLGSDMRGGYGNEPPWKIGEERSIKGELKMCEKGYHASPSWYSALSYAKGSMACLVELSGEVQEETDKYVARTRKLIDAKDADKVLKVFACDCAERALRKAKVPDETAWNALKVARLYIQGKATKDEWDTAKADAWSATYAFAYAAWDAWGGDWGDDWSAWADAWADARASAMADALATRDNGGAWDAARTAAIADAMAAARVARDARAARAAEVKWQKRRLNKLMEELFKEGK